MSAIAVIPARGGSKRIPGKNLKHFLGKPILQRVIETLISSPSISEVYVSTDSDAVAQAALSYGAQVPFMRPIELSDDYASTSAVMKHATSVLGSEISGKAVFCVYPTSVGLIRQDIDAAMHLFESGSWDYVFSGTEPGASPFRAFTQSEIGGAKMLFPMYWDSRSQDLPRAFTDAALLYLARIETWQSEKPIFTADSTFIKIPEFRAVDINTPADWRRAEIALWESFTNLPMKLSTEET